MTAVQENEGVKVEPVYMRRKNAAAPDPEPYGYVVYSNDSQTPGRYRVTGVYGDLPGPEDPPLPQPNDPTRIIVFDRTKVSKPHPFWAGFRAQRAVEKQAVRDERKEILRDLRAIFRR